MTHEELLAYFETLLNGINTERHLLDEFNATVSDRYKLIASVKPCFFSGSLHTGKIVVLNLNPKYIKGGAEDEQAYAVEKYGNLLAFNEDRFSSYRNRGEALPPTFGNMCKHICGNPAYERLKSRGLREAFLQSAVLNLDWCYYYSDKFGGDIPAVLRAKFDEVLATVLREVNPLFIYVMGASFRRTGWIQAYTDINLAMPIREDIRVYKSNFPLYFGNYRTAQGVTGAPLFYLGFGASQVSARPAAEQINSEFLARIPDYAQWLAAKINQVCPG